MNQNKSISLTFCDVMQVVLFAERMIVNACEELDESKQQACIKLSYEECGGEYCLQKIKENPKAVSYVFCNIDHVNTFATLVMKFSKTKTCKERPSVDCLFTLYTESTNLICFEPW